MLFRLGCLFVLVPLVELVLLLRVGQWIGLWPTVALVVITGVLGAALARREGLRTLMAVQSEMARGRVPARPLLDGAAILVGGAFLLTPGILTDIVGFALLLPPVRALFYGWAKGRLARAITQGTVRVSMWGPPPRGPHGSKEGFPPENRGHEGPGDDEPDRPPGRGEIIQ